MPRSPRRRQSNGPASAEHKLSDNGKHWRTPGTGGTGYCVQDLPGCHQQRPYGTFWDAPSNAVATADGRASAAGEAAPYGTFRVAFSNALVNSHAGEAAPYGTFRPDAGPARANAAAGEAAPYGTFRPNAVPARADATAGEATPYGTFRAVNVPDTGAARTTG